MVKVRFARAGSKKRPFYHLVVTDHQKARDSRCIEEIGHYDPSRPIAEAKVDYARLAYWKGVGAQLSETVAKVIRDHSKTQPSA
jgi:small subunit ribosomal protein S16